MRQIITVRSAPEPARVEPPRISWVDVAASCVIAFAVGFIVGVSL